MNWQAFASTFGLLLLAELGDKTQLAVMAQSTKFQSPWAVLMGASLALTLVSGLGICVGTFCANYLPKDLIRYVAGGLFIVMGIYMLVSKA